ncbi:MAG: hypothetical protein NTX45_28495 [Proteobacteria bacterium]|nr:hypothetical protein [Pseudomonadota bacterium]
MNTITQEWNGPVNRLFSEPGHQGHIDLRAGLIGGTFFGLTILPGTGDT